MRRSNELFLWLIVSMFMLSGLIVSMFMLIGLVVLIFVLEIAVFILRCDSGMNLIISRLLCSFVLDECFIISRETVRSFNFE